MNPQLSAILQTGGKDSGLAIARIYRSGPRIPSCGLLRGHGRPASCCRASSICAEAEAYAGATAVSGANDPTAGATKGRGS
jgi:hypothetical protein